MSSTVTAALAGTLLVYLVGVALARRVVQRPTPGARRAASLAFVVAWIVHLSAVVARGMTEQHFPLTNLAEYLLLLGWAVMGLHLLVWFRGRVEIAGLFLPPVAALLTLIAWPLFVASAPMHEMPGDGWFIFHVTSATLGMATLVVALAMSTIYLLQERAIKSRRTLRWIEHFPALERCDHLAYQALWGGFILLTLGMVTGIVVNTSVHSRWWMADPKPLLSAAAWVLFAGVLGSRVAMGFRGRKSAYATIAGVVLGLLTVLGMTL